MWIQRPSFISFLKTGFPVLMVCLMLLKEHGWRLQTDNQCQGSRICLISAKLHKHWVDTPRGGDVCSVGHHDRVQFFQDVLFAGVKPRRGGVYRHQKYFNPLVVFKWKYERLTSFLVHDLSQDLIWRLLL